jgi:hypothetical protein
LINSGRLLQKKHKIMPRSVNSVAKREEKIMKQAKGFGRRKTFGQLLRMR